jgi:hypothetical protein
MSKEKTNNNIVCKHIDHSNGTIERIPDIRLKITDDTDDAIRLSDIIISHETLATKEERYAKLQYAVSNNQGNIKWKDIPIVN